MSMLSKMAQSVDKSFMSNDNDKLLSLKSEIQEIYKLYEKGDLDSFEKRIDEIKNKYINQKNTKKEEKLNNLKKQVEEKEKIIQDLLLKTNNVNESSIKDKYESEYNIKLNQFKSSYKYDIKQDLDYIKLLKEKNELEEKKNNNIESIKNTYQSKINELTETIKKLNDNIIELNKNNEELKSKINKKKANVALKRDEVKSDVEVEEDFGCPVYLFENRNNDTRKKCSGKTRYDVLYFEELYQICKLDHTEDYNALEDAAVYMLNARGTVVNPSNTDKWRNKIKKCHEINELYKEDLTLVYFNIDKMVNIRNKKKFENWKIYLGNKIKEKKRFLKEEADNTDEGFASGNNIIIEDNNLSDTLNKIYDNINKVEKRKKNMVDINNINKLKYIDVFRHNNLDYKQTSINEYKIKYRDKDIKITIDKNLFCDNNTIDRKGGKGIIEFYMYLYDKSYEDTINELNNIYLFYFSTNNKNNINIPSSSNEEDINIIKNQKEKNKDCFVENLNNLSKIKNYLVNERFLKESIIDQMIDNGYLTADDRCNCVFKDLNSDFTFHRGIGKSKFKKNNGNGYINYGNSDSKNLYIFESAIDIISFIELYENKIGNDAYFVSSSGNMGFKKINEYININTEKVFLCFDNDEQGQRDVDFFYKRIKEINKNILITIIKPTLKDFNEDLIKYKKVKDNKS